MYDFDGNDDLDALDYVYVSEMATLPSSLPPSPRRRYDGPINPPPALVRNERDVCRVCGRDVGGTVGDKAVMTTNWITCGRCQVQTREEAR
jgi:hypothetical protein